MFNLIITEESKANLATMSVSNKDLNGNEYKTDVTYLPDSIRISFDTLEKLSKCTPKDLALYTAIFRFIHNKENVVHVSRTKLMEYASIDKSAISRGIKRLIELKLIVLIDKDTYMIPIDTAYKGNLDLMIKRHEDHIAYEEAIRMEDEARELAHRRKKKNSN